MKKITRQSDCLIWIFTTFVLFLTIFSSIYPTSSQDIKSPYDLSPKSSSVHQIIGNSGLASAAALMGGGSGTLNDPYVLFYDPINASLNYCGLLIQNTTKYAILNNTEIFGADLGTGYNITNLNLSSVENFMINNCSFYNSDLDGIFIENATNLIITNINCTNNGRRNEAWTQVEGKGLNIINSDFINISYSHFSKNLLSGIGLENVNNSIIISNNLTENEGNAEEVNGIGLYAADSNMISIIDNNISYNWLRGIHGINLNDWIFESNLVSFNGLSGFSECHGAYIQYSKYIDIINNNFSKNEENGLVIDNSNLSIIKDNLAKENGNSGISITSSDLINIQNNSIENCVKGFNLEWCDNSNFTLNLLNNCGGPGVEETGFFLRSADNNNFKWNIVNNSIGYDFYISNSDLNSIYGNYLYNKSYDANQDMNNWNFTDYGNYWNNYSVYYPGAIATNGIYDTSYERIYNETSSFGNASDYLPLTYDYWQEIYDENLNPPEPLILQSPVLQILDNPDTDGNITLNWDSIENAIGYNIYNSSTFISDIDHLPIYDTTSALNYNFSGLSNGTYYYVVSAYNNSVESNGSNCVWTEVRILPQEIVLPTPILDSINSTDDDGSFRLSWQAVEGAVNYSIYYSSTNPESSGNLEYLITPISSVDGMDLLDTVETTFYDVTGLSNGTYYFVIVANNESGSSEPSEIISVTVEIPPEEEQKPFFTPIIVIVSLLGVSIGAVASYFVPSEKIVDFLKESRDKITRKTKSDVKSEVKGDGETGDLKANEQQLSLEENVPISTEINWQRYISILEKLWNYLPKNLRDMLLNVVDKYLKFRDEAELIILNNFHTLSLGYLSSFILFRTGDKNKCISTLDEITQEAREKEFQNLSEEAEITKEEFDAPLEESTKEKEDLT